MPASAASDLQANIVKVLSAGGPPLSAPRIAKALPVGGRPTGKVLQIELAQMAADGILLRIPGKTERFVVAPVEAWARAALLEALRAGPQSAAKLGKPLTAHFAHLAAPLLDTLLAEGRVFRHPAIAKSGKPVFALTPPDPLPHFAKALDALLASVEAKGFPPAAVRAAVLRHLGADRSPPAEARAPARPAAPPAGAMVAGAMVAGAAVAGAAAAGPAVPAEAAPALSPDAVIEAMGLVEPRVHDGAAVSIARLRDMLGPRHDKKSFDEAVLLLARRGVVELQSHAWPARLTVEQQRQLIDNGRGGWYDSAALNRRETS
jgi:hypothetical protein